VASTERQQLTTKWETKQEEKKEKVMVMEEGQKAGTYVDAEKLQTNKEEEEK
jgi:hypothetical protein